MLKILVLRKISARHRQSLRVRLSRHERRRPISKANSRADITMMPTI